MSKIDELIEQLCPDGVEFKELGDIASYRRGSFPQPYGEVGWYGGENAMPFVQVADVAENMLLVENTKQKISKLAQPKSVFVPKGTVIVTLQGSIGRVAITQYDCFVDRTLAIFERFKIEINTTYFAYQLERKFGVEKENARGSTIKTITKEEFTKFQIPIPPLPIQQEIVNILDKFTELQAELEAELEARKKQYEYYRNKLLTLEDGEVEWKMLGEVTKISNGKDHKLLPDGNFPVYGSGGIMRYANKYIYDQQSVLIPRKGSIGNIFYVDTPFWTVDTLFYTKIKCDIITPKYLYYYLKTQHLEDLNTAGGVPSLTKSVLDKVLIPIPPVAEQERIVAILDKFDALVNDISIGLPAEIEARRKQYEYYRGKLLDFKALASITDNGVEIGQL